MPDGPDPFQSPQWSSDYFRDEVAATQSGRGMVGHVRIVAVLLIVQGVFEILFAFGTFFLLDHVMRRWSAAP